MKNETPNKAVCHVKLNCIGRGLSRALKNTLSIFRDACCFIGGVVDDNWAQISAITGQKQRLTFVETLIHKTAENDPLYPAFDQKFYKFPAYYRRSAINYCLGQVSSYHTRLEDYNTRRKAAIDNGKRFREKAPTLNLQPSPCPSMYKNEMYSFEDGKVYIKLYIRNTWDWAEVSASRSDLKDLDEKAAIGKVLSPTLVYKYHKFYLVFPVKYPYHEFPNTPLKERKVLAVDLGVNHGAVANIMDASGTILGRYFDPFTSERDRIDHMINRIRKIQRKTGGGNSLATAYTKLDGLKRDYNCKLARWITDKAVEHGVYGVVLEHLGRMKGGSKTARIHHWCKCRVRDLVKGMCFREGIRVFQVNPKNTSALAYDGSGEVKRNTGNARRHKYSVCTFASGKQYHCDLNASYNIGARYFLREIQKSMDETKWSQLTAEVPGLAKRTNCTLKTLWIVNSIIAA